MPERPTSISKELDKELYAQLGRNYRTLESMERSLLDKLKTVYKVPIKEDKFGRREALPSEIAATINPTNMNEGLAYYPPTQADILQKDDGKTRVR